MKVFLVPLMLFCAGMLMAVAWIAHLKFKSWSFGLALLASWAFVLPEYLLNVASVRWGHDLYSGAQMAAMHLASGAICVTLVSAFYLGETIKITQLVGFGLMVVSLSLIVMK
jgi:uncharacterized protein (DUF486 family)